MTTEQALRNREKCLAYLEANAATADPEGLEAVRLSVAALREKLERENAKPLTLAELKELAERCEPVYVTRPDGKPMFRDRAYCGAVLDRKITFGGPFDKNLFAIYGDKLTLWESDYGLSWVAYRLEPERREERKEGPLTLDELREMDGLPVWCVSLVDDYSAWAICHIVQCAKSWFIAFGGAERAFGDKDTFGKTWTAYRREQGDGGKIAAELARYKKTGLSPEEIKAVKDTLDELKKEAMPLLEAKIKERIPYNAVYYLERDDDTGELVVSSVVSATGIFSTYRAAQLELEGMERRAAHD